MSSVLLAACALAALTGAPQDDEEAAREAAMFGEADGDAEAAREAAMFGEVETASTATVSGAPVPVRDAPAPVDADNPFGALRSADNVASLLEEAYDKLAIGGLLFFQADLGVSDYGDAPVAVAGQPTARDGLATALGSPSFVDVYLDARPSDRLRAYVRGRVGFDASAVGGTKTNFGQTVEPFTAQLDQAWIKFDLDRALFVTVGRDKAKFGVGRLWNPTDYVNQERLDALAGVTVFDRRLGVGMLKLHLPVESLGWNFYAIGTLDGADALDEPGGVLRAELLLGTTEIAVSGTARKNNPQRVGLSVSSALWWFDVKAEASLAFNAQDRALRGRCNAPQAATEIVGGALTVPESLGEVFDRSDEVVPQIVAGAELGIPVGDDDTIYVGGEYFYNHAGYSDATFYPCLIARGALAGSPLLSGPQPAFTPFYLGRHYLGAYAYVQAPGRWDDSSFFLSAIANISDGSAVLRFDYRHRAMTYLNVNAYVTGHMGSRGGEYRFNFRLPSAVAAAAAQAPVDLSEDTLTFLRDGVPAPVLEAGIGLQVAL